MPSYATTAQVKLAIPITVATFDANIQDIIDGLSSFFDTRYGVSFESVTRVEFHDGRRTEDGLILQRHPDPDSDLWDSSSAEVLEDGIALVRDTDYFVDTPVSRRLLRMDGAGELQSPGFAAGTRNVKVTFPTRFAVIPEDLKAATVAESVRTWKRLNYSATNDGGAAGLVSRGPETGTSLSFVVEDLMPSTVRMLDAYRQQRDF